MDEAPVDGSGAGGAGSRRFEVPEGWAPHVAGLYTRAALRSRASLTRLAIALAAAASFSAAGGPAAWYLLPLVVAVSAAWWTHRATKRAVERVLPEGSVASTEFTDDCLVYRRSAAVDEVRYADVEQARVLDDVVALRLASQRGSLLLPRVLVPDERLAALSAPPAAT